MEAATPSAAGAGRTSIDGSSMGGSHTGASLPRFTKASLNKKKNLKTRMLEQKIREEESRKRHQSRLYRRKLIRRQKRVEEELNYINFPTMLGWYFDGFFTHHFYLRKEWADILNEVEVEFTKKKFADYRETFQEKVARNFWPPSVYNNAIFRTRGVYMDLNEVLRDPPQTPANANFQLADEEDWEITPPDNSIDPLLPGGKHIGITPGTENVTNKHAWYFDEDRGGFFLISTIDPERIYYDKNLDMWRLKRFTRLYAGDFYFDFKRGHFALKNGKFNQNFYKFDKTFHVWVLKGVTARCMSRITPKDYFYDEESCVWILRKRVPKDSIHYDENGYRHAKRIRIPGPDDYYFLLADGTFRPKMPGEGNCYVYDQVMGVWVPIQPPPCSNEPVSSRQRKLLPSDYYFQTHTGRFALKTGLRGEYEFDANNRFYRKKKTLAGKYHPRNWYWDKEKQKWMYGKKSRRHNIFTQILHWRPVRDYERPWLDYCDGHNYIKFNKEAYGFDRAEAGKEGGPMATGTTATAGAATKDTTKDKAADGKKTPGGTAAEGKPGGAEWGDAEFKGLNFDGKAKIDLDTRIEDGDDEDKPEKSQAQKNADEIQKQLMNEGKDHVDEIDKAVDHKRLKCSNLGGIIDESELKAFFASAIAVLKPKDKKALGWGKEDFLYIKFETDEAASAALKTMQGVDIKGQAIKLTYPRRFQR